jgi:NADH-quinone oxidoreductase subunit J
VSGEQIVFTVLAVLALIGAIGVVKFGDDPVHSVMSLVFNFIILAVIYFTLGAQFLGITQVMVYAGAIMVLFLFVVMILKLSSGDLREEKRRSKKVPVVVAGFAGLAIFAVIASQVLMPLHPSATVSPEFGKPQPIGVVVFTMGAWPLVVASMLLMVGIVGSIMLAKRKL